LSIENELELSSRLFFAGGLTHTGLERGFAAVSELTISLRHLFSWVNGSRKQWRIRCIANTVRMTEETDRLRLPVFF